MTRSSRTSFPWRSRASFACTLITALIAAAAPASAADPAPIQPLIRRALDSYFRGDTSFPALAAPGTRQLMNPPSPGGLILPVHPDGRWSCWVSFDPQTAAGRAWIPEVWGTPALATTTDAGSYLPRETQQFLETLRARGVEWQGWIGTTLEFRTPPEEIESLAHLPGAVAVTAPMGPVVDPFSAGGCESTPARSQGLDDMRVPAFQALGYTGQGIRVGILDLGFAGLSERVGGELPRATEARTFGAGDPTQAHGTACAEIVHDVAPEAELYCASIGTAIDLQQALAWMKQNQVEVLSHSLAWFLGGGDGTGPINDLAEEAAGDGMFWITSSGNFAQKHWMGPFRDDDGDSFVELTANRENIRMTRGGTPRLVLLWDRWPLSTDLAFEIEIRDGDEVVATSDVEFEGYPFAFRDVSAPRALENPNFRIRLRSGDPRGVTLRTFRVDAGLLDADDRVPAGSVTIPGDSPSTLAVGAFSYLDQSLEPFSSYGPTLTGLTKPELLGPDAVCTTVRQYSTFVGTSAACPHVAGAAALLLSASLRGALYDVHWNQLELRRLLEAGAGELAEPGPPEAMGWGRVRLWAPGAAATGPRLLPRGRGGDLFLVLTGDDSGAASPRLAAAPPSVIILDANGRRVARIAPALEGRSVRYPLRSAELARGRYWAIEPSTGATGTFSWTAP